MLIVHNSQEARLEEAKRFAAEHGLAEQFQGQLDYLDTYGCHAENGSLKIDREAMRVTLYYDRAPQSFGVEWERRQKDGTYKHFMTGGLILQMSNGQPGDGSAPAFTVSLAKGDGWHVHT